MKSKILFLLGCIPVRILLAAFTYKLEEKYLPYLSVILFAVGASFIYLYITNSRLKAPEAGGETWWKNLRPIHGMFYLIAGLYALKKDRSAAVILVIDVVFGLGAFINHNYIHWRS